MRGKEDCCCRAAYGLIVNGNFIRPNAKDGSTNDMCAAINFKQLQQTQAQDKGAGWGTNVLTSFFGGMYGNCFTSSVYPCCCHVGEQRGSSRTSRDAASSPDANLNNSGILPLELNESTWISNINES